MHMCHISSSAYEEEREKSKIVFLNVKNYFPETYVYFRKQFLELCVKIVLEGNF